MTSPIEELAGHGFRARMVGIHRLLELRQEMEGHRRRGEVSEEFFEERLTQFDFEPPDDVPGARSLLIVAVVQPQIQVLFNWQGKRFPFLIPPTYRHDSDRQVEDILMGALGPRGFGIGSAKLPLKALAARSGLACYGRNNVCYIGETGSFHRLVAFCSDLPCTEESWQEAKMMESCQSCHACEKSCPTGAIPSDRFLLRAERCLTFLNERVGDFPAWVDPGWHECLVGCLRCQRICPLIHDILGWIEGTEEFCEEETRFLVDEGRLDGLPEGVVRKLDRLSLLEYRGVLGRNLRLLLENAGKRMSRGANQRGREV